MITIVELCIRTVLERLIEDIEAVARTRRGEMREWNTVWRLSFKVGGPFTSRPDFYTSWAGHDMGMAWLERFESSGLMPMYQHIGNDTTWGVQCPLRVVQFQAISHS
jgi:hypothetical protein